MFLFFVLACFYDHQPCCSFGIPLLMMMMTCIEFLLKIMLAFGRLHDESGNVSGHKYVKEDNRSRVICINNPAHTLLLNEKKHAVLKKNIAKGK